MRAQYLDKMDLERERGITIKSQAVRMPWELDGTTYCLNMIDTPGHVDFSSEVSTAARLCDGALVIIDVVEGVCTQTVHVLRQAWMDGLRTVLVVNKMDRLITELRLTPNEAHHRLLQLIEQVNAVIGGFYAAACMEQDQRWHEAGADATTRDTREDADLYFDPSRGNVIFASAVDHWAFRLELSLIHI